MKRNRGPTRMQARVAIELELRRRREAEHRRRLEAVSTEELFIEQARMIEEELAFYRAHPTWYGHSPYPRDTTGMTSQEAAVARMTNGELVRRREELLGRAIAFG